jgi:predicted neuraminidase
VEGDVEMESWMCRKCVHGCDVSKKAEHHVTTNQNNLGLEQGEMIYPWSKQNPKEAFTAATESWRRRGEKCVRLQDDYVDKKNNETC